MTKLAKEFFKKMIMTPSPAGYEEPVQEVVRDYVKNFADQIKTDVHGNVIASRNPEAPFRIMLAGHCDQIGFIVNYIDSDGFIYFLTLGGWDPQIVVGSRVIIWAQDGPISGVIGKKPIHLLHDDERNKVTKVQDMWIDIGASSKEAAAKLVRVGDCITMELAYRELLENRIAATATDDKSGVYVVMEALRRIDRNKLKVGVFAVSTVQEEVGMRGARTSAYGIDPQVGIAVDVT
ncbi:MAG: M42 family peptidase, partial [Planctomycetia bacterium]|nr:M42 family peptidase [Planctomycetia bacterium]